MEAKRKLSKFKVTAIAVTEASQGGACSLINDPLVLKSLKEGEKLSKEQLTLLKEIGHTESDIDKSLSESVNNTPSSLSEDNDGEDTLNKNKGTDNDMSEELVKSLQKEVTALKIEKSLSPYQLDSEISTNLAHAMAGIDKEGQDAITKALDFLVACGQYGVALEKSKAPVVAEDNPLAKALSQEQGEGGTAEPVESLSRTDKIKKAQKEIK